MSFDYQTACNWLEDSTGFTRPYQRKNRPLDGAVSAYWKEVAAKLDSPQRNYRLVKVAGSKGKGITASLVAAALQGAENSVGLSTSPHLVDQRERVLIDGEMASDGEFANAIESVSQAAFDNESRTYFGAMMCAGLVAFANAGVDVAVVECGMGGGNDATGFLDADVTVLTGVEREHTVQLGTDIAGIAYEKAAAAAKRTPLVVPSLVPEAEEGVLRAAEERELEIVRVDTNGLDARNACEALATIACGLSQLPFKTHGLSDVLVPCRDDERLVHGAKVVFDGAHTVDSLVRIGSRYGDGSRSLLFSCTPGRDARVLAQAPGSGWKRLYYAGKGEPPYGFQPISMAAIRTLVEQGGSFVVTGSFHFAGDVMSLLGIAPYRQR